MKNDSVLAKTAKGLAAAPGAAGISVRAAALLSAIDGRRDIKTLQRKSNGLTGRDVDNALEELLRAGYVQVLGAPAAMPEHTRVPDNPALLLSLDFTALRTQALKRAAEIAKTNSEDERRNTGTDVSRAAIDEAREAQAKLEAEIRDMLVTALRPRVEEALRVKLAAALKPKIEDELRRTLAAALRPRIEAAMRAQLEGALRPKIELELRGRLAPHSPAMEAQEKGGAQHTASAPAVIPEPPAANDADAARLFACLNEAVFATDVAGVLTRANAAWSQLCGRAEGESTGKALADFFTEADRAGVEAFVGRVVHGTALRFVHEAQLQRGDGEKVWVELHVTPLARASGETTGVCGVLRETAEARRAAAELQDVSLQLLLLVDESAAGVLIEDSEGTIRQVNPAFCSLFGVQAAPFSLEGGAAAELMQEIGPSFADVDELLTRMARIRATAEDVDGCDIALSRGGRVRLSYRAVAEDGPPRGHLWIFRLGPAEPA